MDRIPVSDDNRWRLETPGHQGWARDVRPGDNKYFMISVDSHLMPNMKAFVKRLDKKWFDQLPRVETRENGEKYIHVPGMRPERLINADFQGDDLARSKAGGDTASLFGDEEHGDRYGLERIADQARDGVDGEVIFPNGPVLLMWSSGNVEYVDAMCRAWNDWAWEVCGPY
jgi:hypothetical protein